MRALLLALAFFAKVGLATAGFVTVGLVPAGARAAPLITEAEAARPPLPRPPASRAVTRGPAVELESPRQPIAGPFLLRLRLQGRGGAQVEADSLRITLMRDPPSDLTERLRPHVTPQGIEMRGAEAPAGSYDLRIEVRDSGGRTTTEYVRLEIAPR